MNRPLSPFMNFSRSSSRRLFLQALTLLAFLGISLSSYAQQAPPVSNGKADEIANVVQFLGRLDKAVQLRDINTLRFFGLENATQYVVLNAQSRATHIAFAPGGALVRQAYRIYGAADVNSTQVILASGINELWLSRDKEGNFNFTNKRWSPSYDATAALSEAAREEWTRNANTQNTPLMHLVATRRGGHWIALRRSRWEGALCDARTLARLGEAQNISPDAPLDPDWLRAQMKSAPETGAGVGHFIFQKGPSGWVGLGMAWEPDRRLSPQVDNSIIKARRDILGAAYSQPLSHRALGLALGQIGLFNEATDELEKAEVLQPGVAGPALIKQVADMRSSNPETLAATQLENEIRVGLDPNHPSYLVSALARDYQAQPSVLRALRLGLEYSRLADDERSASWLRAAQELVADGALRNVSASDQQWIQVLFEHLIERRDLSTIKPPVIIRAPLFTLRCWQNELSAIQVLASLEAAQHTVYADFGIPMSSTEVLLWRTQNEFQRYVTRFSSQGNSEFVAALTLTKLIATREGPVVLGEEVNVFADQRTAVFSTVAHEYGHVAVRQLSRGREVPTWFNEGVATSVEGGYDGYLERVRSAAKARAVLPMDEMLAWNVDGERAFLAYSQANSLIDYIVATWGKDAVLNILRQIGSDQDPETVFQNVLGISQQELWRRWAQEGIK